MGIAFSNTTVIPARALDGTSAATLKADIHTLLTDAGWTPATVTGGHTYECTSPQTDLTTPLTAKCRAIDGENLGGTYLSVYLRFESSDNLRQGRQFALRVGVGRTYEAWVNACQLFISLPGYTSDAHSGIMQHAFAGGVPYVPVIVGPDECAAERVHETTEAWWSAGVSFRYAWDIAWGDSSACYNGTLTTDYGSQLFLCAQQSPASDFSGVVGQQVQWCDGTPLYFDPLLAWDHKVRAQLWDAIRGSKDAPLDDEIETEEAPGAFYTWRNWMHHKDINAPTTSISAYSYHSSLYLLQATPSAAVNVAY